MLAWLKRQGRDGRAALQAHARLPALDQWPAGADAPPRAWHARYLHWILQEVAPAPRKN
ncbi:hypothetical protein [Xanthomonas theicola]|uniref:hypothetical protein n=1 Tax=Xanthomonas theicola TaxID=56464 RepID=UPI001304A415|nr:hypothetical protein [Xanthomonas theicola]QNH25738.1 hypothetical protein G4Q83_14605 [Xanthomonas theicola]